MDVASFGFKTTKFQGDPTASGVPLLAANPEQGFFKDLDDYRFDTEPGSIFVAMRNSL
jgi:hypothetical protein